MRTLQRPQKVVAILSFLMFLQAFFVTSSSTDRIVNAQLGSNTINTVLDYGDLGQYEWPQIHGDSGFTRFSDGPAPEAADIKWKTNITNIQSFVAAFNGKVFVTTKTEVIALDKDTGIIVWNTTVPKPERWPAVFKIDASHLVIGRNCLSPETGEVIWVSDDFAARVDYWAEGVYSPEEKMFYNMVKSYVQAWDFSDPSKPPMLVWETYVPGGGASGSGIQYGDGKVFPGSFDSHQVALNARTGELLWDTETKGSMIFSGSYYKGKFFRAGEHDNTFYCFDAETGEILWTFNPGTQFGYWVSGCAVAYGKVYELNKDGHLYALDVDTGEVVWKYAGPGYLFWPGWPVVADGKIYATTGQAASYDPITGEYSLSEFVCLDAYTGNLVWSLPIEAHPPRESVAIAYGNLYLIPGYIIENTMNSYITPDEVWCVGTESWPMWRHDPENTGTGQSGPTNLTLKWKYTTNGAIVSSPSVVGGRVYVGSQDRHLYCIDARQGFLIWSFETDTPIKSSPAIVDGKVYLGPDDGHVYCLNAENGSLIWKKRAGGYVQAHFDSVARLCSSPTVKWGRVYVGSLDKKVYSLDADTGEVTWVYNTEGYITSSPAILDGALFIISQEPASAGLYKLNAESGSLIWKLEIPYKLKYERGTDMHGSPTVADGMLFTSANKDEYYGVNATTSEIKWISRTIEDAESGFLVASEAYNNGKLYIVNQFFIACIDSENGNTIWKSWLGGEIYVSPTYADDKIYIATDRRAVYILNATNGDKLSYFETGSNCRSSPAIYEGRLYIGNNDWNLYCLAEYPSLASSVDLELEKTKVDIGESMAGSGLLTPNIENVAVMVAFSKPDGSIDEILVLVNEKGTFNFTFTPNVSGKWSVSAYWQSDKGYYSSAYSETIALEVEEDSSLATPSPKEEGAGIRLEYLFIIIVIMAVIALVGSLFWRRAEKTKSL